MKIKRLKNKNNPNSSPRREFSKVKDWEGEVARGGWGRVEREKTTVIHSNKRFNLQDPDNPNHGDKLF